MNAIHSYLVLPVTIPSVATDILSSKCKTTEQRCNYR